MIKLERQDLVQVLADVKTSGIFGSELIIENQIDHTLLTPIPEGEFLFGGSGSNAIEKPFPVFLPKFKMALHPITNAQYKVFIEATGHKPPGKSSTGEFTWTKDGFPPKLAHHPVVNVTYRDAQAYCKWSGLRLPNELEWEKAARGWDGRLYPWGNKWEAGNCRNRDNCGHETTCSVWEYPKGCSPFGVYQMSGNVLEWCSDWYEATAYRRYQQGDLTPPVKSKCRVLRGSGWSHRGSNAFQCSVRRYSRPSVGLNHRGFRCAI